MRKASLSRKVAHALIERASIATPSPVNKAVSESSANEHAWAEQWLYVVSGTGSARIANRTIRLRSGSLVLIERREPHVIRAGARSRLVTFNLYVPPAYSPAGEPLRRTRGR